jgi:hypothetical protein
MINIPFNFQPESVAVKTASYDIPAGKFAYVTAYVENGGTFTIDGSVAMTSFASIDRDIVAVYVSGGTGVGASYAVPTDYKFTGQCLHASNVADVTVNGAQTGVSSVQNSSTPTYFEVGGGHTISVAGVSGNKYLVGRAERSHIPATFSTQTFWVPAGTTIAGTGTWKATVSIYNEIS